MRTDRDMPLADIEGWLREEDEGCLAELWRAADETRRRCVGDEVHLRGLLEISNHCVRSCAYCGLRRENSALTRYRMTADEVLQSARRAEALGYGTVVMQAGEDYGISREFLAEVISSIKSSTPMAVTLGMGERPQADLRAWREAGADRYLLRFETSDEKLYARIHPDLNGKKSDRLAILRFMRLLGYEIGGGVMIGVPGQSYASLALDIDTFRREDFDMIGVGPFIPNPDTPLGSVERDGEVRAVDTMAYKVLALTRLVCPRANIPATTALSVINESEGRARALSRGANVVMPNVTPVEYRRLYEIYPCKDCAEETAEVCADNLRGQIESLGRRIGTGRGDSPRMSRR